MTHQNEAPQKVHKTGTLRKYFFAGLLVWLPVIATVVVFRFMIETLDQILTFLPTEYQPQVVLGMYIPGFGLVLSAAILLLTGVVATNFLGKWLVDLWEYLLSHIPFVRAIYKAVKQVLETLFNTGNDSFRRVFLVEYPRKGMWAVAFQTGNSLLPTHDDRDNLSEMFTIFVPTTPNPTSGFLMMVRKEEVIELDISVDEALKLIISLGVVQPDKIPAKADNN